MTPRYDSTHETLSHIKRVQYLLFDVIKQLQMRQILHDSSKLVAPEKYFFDEYTPQLKGATYGSDEYKGFLTEMQPALENHYKENQHHPEHFPTGINGMTLIDLIEMLCDWKAASERHEDGDIKKSIDINCERFGISEQLAAILHNTRKFLWTQRPLQFSDTQYLAKKIKYGKGKDKEDAEKEWGYRFVKAYPYHPSYKNENYRI